MTPEKPQFKILIIGLGGLGSPAASLLAMLPFAHFGLMDPDIVEPSNLHRQILYDDSDIGKPKAETAARKLQAKHPNLKIEVIPEAFPNRDWEDLIARYDLVIDGLDRLEKKYALNDACVKAGKPFVHAGVVRFGGQILAVRPGVTACLRCVLPEIPPPDVLPTCQMAGILGPVAQWAGYWQAKEAQRLLSGSNELFLWTFDSLKRETRAVKPSRHAHCPACGKAKPDIDSCVIH